MLFATPIYLLLLIPWSGVVAWVLLGRAEFARVSTTQFWEKTDTSTRTRRGIRRPPAWSFLMLIAMLAAILAASGLSITVGDRRVVWVVDRNLMTITDLRHDRSLLDRIDASTAVAAPATSGRFDQPTTLDTRSVVAQAVDRMLRESELPVVLVTSQDLKFDIERVTVMHPAPFTPNAGIDRFAIVTRPKAQAMVTLYNGTNSTQATLHVGEASQTIDLPPTGQTRDYFVDLTRVGEVMEAVLELPDEINIDNHAWLVRSHAVPRLTPTSGLGEAVERFIAVYEQNHPPATDAPRIAITDDAHASTPAVIIRSGSSSAAGTTRANDHSVNRWIDWETVAPLIRDSLADAPPRGTPIVWIDNTPIVTADAGRVEIGFDINRLSSRAEFVMLLGNAIEFASGGLSEYIAVAPGTLGPNFQPESSNQKWQVDDPPGVYSDGMTRRAVNVKAFRPKRAAPAPNPPMPQGKRNTVSLERALVIVSMAGVLTGLFCLTRNGRRVR